MSNPSTVESESTAALLLKHWLRQNGGYFHPCARFVTVHSGFNLITTEDLPNDTTIATCPFSLAVTEDVAQRSLLNFLNVGPLINTTRWNERQWISTYLCFHSIVPHSSHLAHYAYLDTLPAPNKLRTPLHFYPTELAKLKGTNLYFATLEREGEWRAEWSQCHAVVTDANSEWGEKFTWELYLTAATYLTSRAFPSTLLTRTPSLQPSPSMKPVLLPGIDALNHGRGQPVSWVVSHPENEGASSSNRPSISLVIHSSAAAGQELLNNYGAKPNSELILGYGFSLPQNPEDTIILKVVGIDGKRWEVGRSAKGMTELWDEIVRLVQEDSESLPNYEGYLAAAATLADMAKSLLDRLPSSHPEYAEGEVREEVASMLHDYINGQRDILKSVMDFAHEQERAAVDTAHEQGVEIILED